MEITEDVKKRILKAAEDRFVHYGFKKTTMAEIATDCNMSAANIYRFFKNKEEIAVELTQRCFSQFEDSLRNIMRKPNISASERLEGFILDIFRKKHEMCLNRPKLNDLIEYIHNNQADIVYHFFQIKESMIGEILADGNRTEEFDIPDIITTANLILKSAESLFFSSMFCKNQSTELNENDPKGLINLIINGLKKK